MYYTTERSGSNIQYTYKFENDASCIFSVSNVGVITPMITGYIPEELVCEALNEVTNLTIQQGVTPQININHSNHFLQEVATQCHYSKIPSFGISFAIWRHPINT